jgi:hypothetical protein
MTERRVMDASVGDEGEGRQERCLNGLRVRGEAVRQCVGLGLSSEQADRHSALEGLLEHVGTLPADPPHQQSSGHALHILYIVHSHSPPILSLNATRGISSAHGVPTGLLETHLELAVGHQPWYTPPPNHPTHLYLC